MRALPRGLASLPPLPPDADAERVEIHPSPEGVHPPHVHVGRLVVVLPLPHQVLARDELHAHQPRPPRLLERDSQGVARLALDAIVEPEPRRRREPARVAIVRVGNLARRLELGVHPARGVGGRRARVRRDRGRDGAAIRRGPQRVERLDAVKRRAAAAHALPDPRRHRRGVGVRREHPRGIIVVSGIGVVEIGPGVGPDLVLALALRSGAPRRRERLLLLPLRARLGLGPREPRRARVEVLARWPRREEDHPALHRARELPLAAHLHLGHDPADARPRRGSDHGHEVRVGGVPPAREPTGRAVHLVLLILRRGTDGGDVRVGVPRVLGIADVARRAEPTRDLPPRERRGVVRAVAAPVAPRVARHHREPLGGSSLRPHSPPLRGLPVVRVSARLLLVSARLLLGVVRLVAREHARRRGRAFPRPARREEPDPALVAPVRVGELPEREARGEEPQHFRVFRRGARAEPSAAGDAARDSNVAASRTPSSPLGVSSLPPRLAHRGEELHLHDRPGLGARDVRPIDVEDFGAAFVRRLHRDAARALQVAERGVEVVGRIEVELVEQKKREPVPGTVAHELPPRADEVVHEEVLEVLVAPPGEVEARARRVPLGAARRDHLLDAPRRLGVRLGEALRGDESPVHAREERTPLGHVRPSVHAALLARVRLGDVALDETRDEVDVPGGGGAVEAVGVVGVEDGGGAVSRVVLVHAAVAVQTLRAQNRGAAAGGARAALGVGVAHLPPPPHRRRVGGLDEAAVPHRNPRIAPIGQRELATPGRQDGRFGQLAADVRVQAAPGRARAKRRLRVQPPARGVGAEGAGGGHDPEVPPREPAPHSLGAADVAERRARRHRARDVRRGQEAQGVRQALERQIRQRHRRVRAHEQETPPRQIRPPMARKCSASCCCC